MVRENYVKIYDRYSSSYVYKNRNTKEISRTKPKFLGSEDLPNPRHFNAPLDYDPQDDYPIDGFALLVTVNKFREGKLPDISPASDSDHFHLENLLTHDFICKFRQENIIVLKQPTCLDFNNALNRLRRICKTKGYFVCYICTHVVTVHNGEKANKKETGYICMADTLWTRPAMIANTSISLSHFVSAIQKIDCLQKTVILNYAHVPETTRSPLGSKFLYPPSDFATRLANEASCAVITNCTTGTLLNALVKHTAASSLLPRIWKEKTMKVKRLGKKLNFEEKFARRFTARVTAARKTQVHPDITEAIEGFNEDSITLESPPESSNNQLTDTTGVSSRHFALPPISSKFLGRHHLNAEDDYEPLGPTENAPFEDMFHQYVADWQLELKSEDVYVTPIPVTPVATWFRDEHNDFAIKADLPTEKDYAKHRGAMRWWKFKRFFSRPVNEIKRRMRLRAKRQLKAPFQHNLVIDSITAHDCPNNTLFGLALIKCLKGGASVPDQPLITVEMLYHKLKQVMLELHQLADMAVVIGKSEKKPIAIAVAPANDENGSPDDKQTTPVKPSTPGEHALDDEEESAEEAAVVSHHLPAQSPTLILPRKEPFALDNAVCCRCGPPCAPDRPYIIRVGRNEVMIEWYNPHFDGISPSKYEVSMYNISRNFKKWTPVYYPGDIIKTSFLVRNLPMGVPCQFRVAAYNNGGWGAPSLETILVIPGEDVQPLSTLRRWRKLTLGGALGVLDRLDEYPAYRAEHVTGLHKLIMFAQKDSGFSKGLIPVKSALEAIFALQNYPDDIEIAVPAFMLLAWCLRGKRAKNVTKALLQHDIGALCIHYMKAFRENSGLLGNIGMVRSSLAVSKSAMIPFEDPIADMDSKKKKKKKQHGSSALGDAFSLGNEPSDSDSDTSDNEDSQTPAPTSHHGAGAGSTGVAKTTSVGIAGDVVAGALAGMQRIEYRPKLPAKIDTDATIAAPSEEVATTGGPLPQAAVISDAAKPRRSLPSVPPIIITPAGDAESNPPGNQPTTSKNRSSMVSTAAVSAAGKTPHDKVTGTSATPHNHSTAGTTTAHHATSSATPHGAASPARHAAASSSPSHSPIRTQHKGSTAK